MVDCKSFEHVKQLVDVRTRKHGLAFLDQCIQRPLDPAVRFKVILDDDDKNVTWKLQIFVGERSFFLVYLLRSDGEEALITTSPCVRHSTDKQIYTLAAYLFDECFPLLHAIARVERQIDEAMGDLAVRIVPWCSSYRAGDLMYDITSDGRIRFFGDENDARVTVQTAIPRLEAALRQGFPYVTRGPIETKTLMYIYGPKSNTECPRADVIAHFEQMIVNKEYEPGAAFSYKEPRSTFTSGSGWMGRHCCEGTTCERPSSFAYDLHLVKDGKPTYFVTNSLAAHYLQKHWQDVYDNKDELKRLNEYLEHVGINPIA